MRKSEDSKERQKDGVSRNKKNNSLSFFMTKGEKKGRGGTSVPHSLKRDIL